MAPRLGRFRQRQGTLAATTHPRDPLLAPAARAWRWMWARHGTSGVTIRASRRTETRSPLCPRPPCSLLVPVFAVVLALRTRPTASTRRTPVLAVVLMVGVSAATAPPVGRAASAKWAR